MTRPQAIPICPACGELMNGVVHDFRAGGEGETRYYCLICGESAPVEIAPEPVDLVQEGVVA